MSLQARDSTRLPGKPHPLLQRGLGAGSCFSTVSAAPRSQASSQTHLNKVNLKLLLQETHGAAQCPQHEGEAGLLDLARGCVEQTVLYLGENGTQQPCYQL